MFLWAIPAVLVALAVSLFIKELPLKARQAAAEGLEGRRAGGGRPHALSEATRVGLAGPSL